MSGEEGPCSHKPGMQHEAVERMQPRNSSGFQSLPTAHKVSKLGMLVNSLKPQVLIGNMGKYDNNCARRSYSLSEKNELLSSVPRYQIGSCGPGRARTCALPSSAGSCAMGPQANRLAFSVSISSPVKWGK